MDLTAPTHVLDVPPGHDPRDLLEREWLLTNGTGAFAMGTALGCPTRRYHGLFIAATRPPVGRILALNQMWEQLVLRGVQSPKSQVQSPEHESPASTLDFGQGTLDSPPPPQPLEFSTLLFRAPDGQRVFAPRGYEMLKRFERGLSVRWVYAWGDIGFERELLLHWKEQAATIRYRITGLDAAHATATLRLQPMLTLRDYHALLHRAGSGPFSVEAVSEDQPLTVRHDGQAVTFACDRARFVHNEHWWYSVYYPVDAERGQGDNDDYFVPGTFEIDLPAPGNAPHTEVCFTVALGEQPAQPVIRPDARAEHLRPIVEAVASSEFKVPSSRKTPSPQALNSKPGTRNPELCLALAADDFVVDRTIAGERLSTILAGYPWFADWGRDTFIALPGLLLNTGRHAEARAVLRTFARAIQDGLVPNRFDDYHDQAAHYNTVDASLWFIHAALQYLDAAADRDAWRTWLADACIRIVEAYIVGTGAPGEVAGVEQPVPAPGDPAAPKLIRMDADALITAGHHRTQLTWMDAACAGSVFTPRPGKAVEVNALWYNALLGLADALAEHGPDAQKPRADRYRQLASKAKRSFNELFWSDELGYLLDHVWTDAQGQAHPDASLRPNQIFAVALPRSPLAPARQKKVLAVVRDRLLTPVGLRTLPPEDPHYHSHYTGEQYHRDEAYHQGTIWAWLIGPYAEAVLRVGKFSPKARAEAAAALAPLLTRLAPGTLDSEEALGDSRHASIGQLHEIYEADPPHRPVGCMAQAWSIAELLRAWHLTHA